MSHVPAGRMGGTANMSSNRHKGRPPFTATASHMDHLARESELCLLRKRSELRLFMARRFKKLDQF